MFSITSATIHVWQLDLDLTDSQYQQFALCLNPEELARADKFTHNQAQQQFIAARGQLKQILAGYLHLAPETILFETGEYGKPRLAGTAIDRGLVFNLSHSGLSALVAVSIDRALGIDIEQINDRHNLQALAKRCFSQHELNTWEKLPANDKTTGFYAYWCAKEAFLKATGRGLALGMERCVVDIDQSCYSSLPEPYLPMDWHLHCIDAGFGYQAYVTGNGDSVEFLTRHSRTLVVP